jgi:DNA-binding CsgD family transcriptional regulator
MPNSLQQLFATIDRVKGEPDLRSQLLPQLGTHFQATRRGIFYLDTIEQTLRELLPALDPQIERILQLALSIDRNPVARYLVEHHAPVHEALVTTPKIWTTICPRADHWHVMAGPIVNHGSIVGVIACTRDRSQPAFDAHNLTDLSAICLHLSVWTATVRSTARTAPQIEGKSSMRPATGLTPRELQIAELIALGRTNAEIGNELWITENSVKQALKRMFRKLEVSSRAELVARLLTVC